MELLSGVAQLPSPGARMKVGQKTIVRWIAQVASVGRSQADRKQHVQLRELDAGQLRNVSGGTGGSTQSPGKTW
jgi:hypothetical protein